MRLSIAFPVVLLAAGCVMPNRYGTPRTLAPGESGHVINIDVLPLESSDLSFTTDGEGSKEDSGSLIVPWPSYTFRHGLWDGGELGVGFGPLMMLLGDLKLRLLETTAFDAAVAPTVGVGALEIFSTDQDLTLMASLPVLLGVNLGEKVSLVPIAAIHGFRWKNEDGSPGSGALTSFGLSVQWRVLPDLSLQPGVMGLWEPGTDKSVWIHGGIAFVAGSQPSYAPPPPPPRWGD